MQGSEECVWRHNALSVFEWRNGDELALEPHLLKPQHSLVLRQAVEGHEGTLQGADDPYLPVVESLESIVSLY